MDHRAGPESTWTDGASTTGVAKNNCRKDELVSMVCHELRSPLASIRYATRLLNNQAVEAPAREQQLRALLDRQVGRMSRLVDDLLDLASMRNDRLRLHCARLDLREIVKHAAETLAPDIGARAQELVTSAPDGPVWLTGDAFRLEQVFVNLLANAAKYTQNGGRLAVEVQARDTRAMVCVRDSGIGIAPQLLPHIFDLFRQADAADPRSRSGFGIGLAVVRSLVELHGGHVTAASRGPGHGSEFTVWLPREG